MRDCNDRPDSTYIYWISFYMMHQVSTKRFKYLTVVVKIRYIFIFAHFILILFKYIYESNPLKVVPNKLYYRNWRYAKINKSVKIDLEHDLDSSYPYFRVFNQLKNKLNINTSSSLMLLK